MSDLLTLKENPIDLKVILQDFLKKCRPDEPGFTLEEEIQLGSLPVRLKFTQWTTISALDIIITNKEGTKEITFGTTVEKKGDKVVGDFNVSTKSKEGERTFARVGDANQIMGLEMFPEEAQLSAIMLQSFANIFNTSISHTVICNPVKDRQRRAELVGNDYTPVGFDLLAKIFTPE